MNDTVPAKSSLPEETSSPPVNMNNNNTDPNQSESGLHAETGLSEETTGDNIPNPLNSIHMDITETSNIVSPTATSSKPTTLPVHTGLDVETGSTMDQQNLPPVYLRDETHYIPIGDQIITSLDAETTSSVNQLNIPTIDLHDETPHTLTDVMDLSNTDFNDKIDAAQGLLLLGTDVSSADDSQEPPELPLPAAITTVGLHDETDARSIDSDKTITTEVSTTTHSPNATSLRKGVLNLRQIGIKRHQPVDSSHPSAIGSPPGSPNTEKPVRTKQTPHRNSAGSKKDQQKNNNKPNSYARNKTKETKGNKNNATKDKVARLNTPQTSAPRTTSNKCRTKASTRWAPASTATTASAPTSRDTPDNGTKGKYSIKRTVVSGTIYYCCSYCNKNYDTLHGLNNHHENTHPPVNCDVCNRVFSTPNSLIHHSYTHLEQSFHCDQCEKLFPFKSQMENHVSVHTQAVKHRCDKCGKEFVRTGEYNIHMRGHSNIRIHCPIDGCEYETVDVRNLTSHKKSHTKRISVYCKICGEGFVYHEQRKRHMKQTHS